MIGKKVELSEREIRSKKKEEIRHKRKVGS